MKQSFSKKNLGRPNGVGLKFSNAFVGEERVEYEQSFSKKTLVDPMGLAFSNAFVSGMLQTQTQELFKEK